MNIPKELLENLLENTRELAGERAWWRDEPRLQYKEDYQQYLVVLLRGEEVLRAQEDGTYWRLLAAGDIMHEGVQHLADDAETWVSLDPRWYLQKYHRALMPAREPHVRLLPSTALLTAWREYSDNPQAMHPCENFKAGWAARGNR